MAGRTLAVANYYSNNVSILPSNGDGTFQPPVNYAVGTNPVSLAAGGFNGDRKRDLAVVNSGSNSVSVLLGKGDGTFRPIAVRCKPASQAGPSVTASNANYAYHCANPRPPPRLFIPRDLHPVPGNRRRRGGLQLCIRSVAESASVCNGQASRASLGIRSHVTGGSDCIPRLYTTISVNLTASLVPALPPLSIAAAHRKTRSAPSKEPSCNSRRSRLTI